MSAEKPVDPVAAESANEAKLDAPAAPVAPAAAEPQPVDGTAAAEVKEAPAAEVDAAAAAPISAAPAATAAAEAAAPAESADSTTTKPAEPQTAEAAAPSEAKAADVVESKPAEVEATAASTEKPAESTGTAAVTAAAAAGPATAAPGAATSAEPTTSDTKEKTATATATSPDTKDTPIQRLWSVAKAHGHPEIWGVHLADPETHVPSQIVLQKYLNANDGDFAKAKDQLVKTLDWRAQTKPLELLKEEFAKAKFEGLGYVTSYGDLAAGADPETREIFTWNIYGATKSIDETFGKLDEFIRWRVALMELALQDLSLSTATKPITADADPYKLFQVHDYKSISFFRQSSHVKAASSETIRVFAQNYPELLKEKFFVNVPAIMGFMYAFMKLFVAPKTIKKFHPMSNGRNLAAEFAGGNTKVQGLGEKLPEEYGGKGKELNAESKEPLLK